MSFHFKKFSVDDDKSSMRVGTDAVLLGSWIRPSDAGNILDIGTGCGVIALMMAQRSNAHITAIDIDRDSAFQASVNFRRSPWDHRMKASHISFREFLALHNNPFDLIISNPPWFRNSLKSNQDRRNLARHDDHLKQGELFEGITKLLSKNGSFYIIVPAENADSAEYASRENDLFLKRRMMVIPRPGRKPTRAMMEYSFFPAPRINSEEITIRLDDRSYTSAYRELTNDFYLDF